MLVGKIPGAESAHTVARKVNSTRIYRVFAHHLVEESDNRLGVSPVFTLRTLRREHDEWKRLVPVDNGRQTKARFSQLLDILSSTRSAMGDRQSTAISYLRRSHTLWE